MSESGSDLSVSVLGWTCCLCDEKAEDPIHLENDFITHDRPVYIDSDNSMWVRCPVTYRTYHLYCSGHYDRPPSYGPCGCCSKYLHVINVTNVPQLFACFQIGGMLLTW